MREEESELSEDESSNGSEDEDDVPELAVDDNERSPSSNRSPVLRRVQTMNIVNGQIE